MSWSEGYFSEFSYISEYYREFAPTFIDFCLWLNGLQAPKKSYKEQMHCELGFGQGVSINIHAASNQGSFYGTDFTPLHASNADDLAKASGADIYLYDDSFAQFLQRDDLPMFDYISIHGIYSWISHENQQYLVDFVSKYLNYGGALYISYNALPGHNLEKPLRDLFAIHDRFLGTPGDDMARVEKSMEFIKDFLELNPGHLQANPMLGHSFQGLEKKNKIYLAHEYLNAHSYATSFLEVADAFARAKVDFAAQAMPLESVEAIQYSDKTYDFIHALKSRMMREQLNDYIHNRKFRRDIYVKGARKLSRYEILEQLKSMYFVLVDTPNKVPKELKGAAGTLAFQESAYGPMVKALEANDFAPKSGEEIIAAYGKSFHLETLVQALGILSGHGVISPAFSPEDTAAVKANCVRFNAHVFKQSLYSSHVSALASPVTGSGRGMHRFISMLIYFEKQGATPKEAVEALINQLKENGEVILDEGKRLESYKDAKAYVQKKAKELDEALPLLKALQVV